VDSGDRFQRTNPNCTFLKDLMVTFSRESSGATVVKFMNLIGICS